jgi:hypothetical protein
MDLLARLASNDPQLTDVNIPYSVATHELFEALARNNTVRTLN